MGHQQPAFTHCCTHLCCDLVEVRGTPLLDNYMTVDLPGNFLPALNSIVVGFCFETWNNIHKFFILTGTVSKGQAPSLPTQILSIDAILLLPNPGQILLTSLTCSMENLKLLRPSTLQGRAHGHPLAVRCFSVAYCHRKLKARQREQSMVLNNLHLQYFCSEASKDWETTRLSSPLHWSMAVFNCFLPSAWRYLFICSVSSAWDTFFCHVLTGSKQHLDSVLTWQ